MDAMVLEWKEVAAASPQDFTKIAGEEVLGYNPEWICEDFNPKGIRACAIIVLDNESELAGGWVSSKWHDEQDSWFSVDEAPTHYAVIPAFDPSMLKGGGK